LKGVLLCGGKGTRLYPLTKVTNKHLLSVGRQPMIVHSIEKLKEAGIVDICIITGPDHAGDFIDLLGSGAEYGVNLTYKVQDTANGIAGALSLCKDVVGNDRFVVILGDNLFADSLRGKLSGLSMGSAKIFIKEVPNPKDFGCVVWGEDIYGETVISAIEEKPKYPQSSDAVVGIYIFDRHVFNYIDQVEPSNRGELEIADVLNFYIQNGTLRWAKLKQEWLDCGQFDSYWKANEWFYKQEQQLNV
jgi:glucose-1-phosphate thymidylyltransferase